MMKAIDAHIHCHGDHADNVAMLEKRDLKLLNICVAHSGGDWRDQEAVYQKLVAAYPERYAWVTSFDLPDFSDDYADRVIEDLKKSFAAGATGCKVWKNIGMEVKTPSGEFMMVDDPIFDPIFEFLAKEERTLLMHIGEPLACWRPLVNDNPHYGYYSKNPQWHMYDKPEYPSHEAIMAARDRMVAKNPKLRIVGAHLASLEWDVAEVAKRFDQFPNFAVDTSARVADLAYQDSDVVCEFIEAYPDRVLFGTDVVQRDLASELSEEKRQAQIGRLNAQYDMEFAYYETDEMVTVRGKETRGLGLSGEVLENLYYKNAQQWYPGL